MLLDKVRRLLRERVGAFSVARGLGDPPSAGLSPAPAHAAADAALSWPLAAAKAARAKPLDLARELAVHLQDPAFEAVDAAAPGFVNLRLSAEALTENLAALLKDPSRYGTPDSPRPGKFLFEFVSANPTGPLHLGSGRAAALGDCLVRILRRLGCDAAGEYYVNDAGRQVELLGLSVKAWYEHLKQGTPSPVLPEGGYQGDYVKDLAAGLPEVAAGWDAARFGREAVERILALHKQDMEDYRVSFDRWALESELHARGAVETTLAFLKSRGMVYEKDGAAWLGTASQAEGAPGADDKDRVLVRSDGRPTYFLGDIAYHKDKFDRGWETLVDVWGADHHGYVPRMKAAIAALGRPPGSFVAIVHQLVHLTRGGEKVKMSKRAGEFVTLRELMAEVGVDACRFFFAMHTPNTHMNFDLELAKKQSQDNPAYYVQYVHARIASIFREAAAKGVLAEGAPLEGPRSLPEPESRALLVKLVWFPRALEACADDLSPHHLTTYLSELAGLYHVFYEHHRVVDPADLATSRSRLALCGGVLHTIHEGLSLLGVSAPGKM